MTAVLAIAWNVLRELARKRSTALFFLLVAGSALTLPYASSGDGSLRMRLQVAVTYGVGFPAFLIAVATIAAAAGLARDVESRRIQLLVTKPVGSVRIVLGKLLGIVIADAALLLIVLVAFVISVASIQSSRASSEEDRRSARQRFFTARAGVLPEMAPPDEASLKAYTSALRQEGGAAGDASDASLAAKARRALRSLRVPPSGSAELEFRGLQRGSAEPASDEDVLIRYEVYLFKPGESPRVDVEWQTIARQGTAAVARAAQVLHGVPQEVALPASAISADGSLRVRVRNLAAADSGATLVIDPAKVEALPVHGRFWPNVARGFLLVLAQLALLASLVLAASCIFTSPTAVFLGLFLYLTALSSGFLRETFELYSRDSRVVSWTERVEKWTSAFGGAVIDVLPDFATVDPIERLAAARAITAADLLREAGWITVAEAAPALIVGALLLRRRELGR